MTTDPDLRGIEHLGGDSGAARIVDSLDDLTGEADIVVDVMDPIEGATGQSEYVDFLNAVSRWCSETGGLAVLHCLDTGSDPDNRKFTLTERERMLDIDLGRDVYVDVSRKL